MTLKKRRAAKPECFQEPQVFVGVDLARSPMKTIRYATDPLGNIVSYTVVPPVGRPIGPIGSGKTAMQANDVLLRECARFRERMRGVRIPFWRRVSTDLWWIRWNIGLWFLRLCRRIGRIFV